MVTKKEAKLKSQQKLNHKNKWNVWDFCAVLAETFPNRNGTGRAGWISNNFHLKVFAQPSSQARILV